MAANSHALDLESGSSQYASIADGSQTGLDLSGSFSIAGWIKKETDGIDEHLVAKWNTSGNQRAYALGINTSNQLVLSTSSDGSGQTNATSTTTFVVAGGHTHFAVTVNLGAGTCQFYKNGTAIETGSTTTSLFNSTADFSIGALFAGAATNFVDGIMDEVVVTSDELTAGEVLQLYQGRDASLILNNIKGYWKLNNDYADSSGNSNTLTASGSPTFVTDVPFVNYAGDVGFVVII